MARARRLQATEGSREVESTAAKSEAISGSEGVTTEKSQMSPMRKKVYVAGPMTGYPELNYPAFAYAAALLRERGFEVVSPAELNPIDTGYRDAMRTDILALIDCDHIFRLDGWEKSKGATLENHIAEVMGIPVLIHHFYCGEVHVENDPECDPNQVIYFDEAPEVLEQGFNG